MGAPLALYSDRHGIFTKADPEDTKPPHIAAQGRRCSGPGAERSRASARLCSKIKLGNIQPAEMGSIRPAATHGIDNIEQANSWLDDYLREHNRRFALTPKQAQDMHRRWGGSAQALADICALHHQRQLSAQGACKFEGSILQLCPQQPHAPKARAMVGIAQHGDGTLHLSYRGQPLTYRSYAMHQSRHADPAEDHKTLNARVDRARDAQQLKLQRLKAELAFQDSQRLQGVFRPDTPPIVPRAGAGRYGLRPAQPTPASGA